MIGIRIHGNVVIVDPGNSEEVIKPRLIALTRSAIPRTLQTTRAYLDQLKLFLKKYAKGIAVTPIKISPTPADMPKAGGKIPWETPHRKAMPTILQVCTATRIEVVLLYRNWSFALPKIAFIYIVDIKSIVYKSHVTRSIVSYQIGSDEMNGRHYMFHYSNSLISTSLLNCDDVPYDGIRMEGDDTHEFDGEGDDIGYFEKEVRKWGLNSNNDWNG
jgi:hypothetical protein